jgi:hypothetical protein
MLRKFGLPQIQGFEGFKMSCAGHIREGMARAAREAREKKEKEAKVSLKNPSLLE